MKINFSKFENGLVPTIIQDSKTGVVLMLGYMSEESLAITQKEKRVTPPLVNGTASASNNSNHHHNSKSPSSSPTPTGTGEEYYDYHYPTHL